VEIQSDYELEGDIIDNLLVAKRGRRASVTLLSSWWDRKGNDLHGRHRRASFSALHRPYRA
jgi:hypothetical protein